MHAAFNRLPFRGRLLFFVGGCFVGGGGFAGYSLHQNREVATRPPGNSEASQSVATMQPPLSLVSERVKRWVSGRWWWPIPHWADTAAEMLPRSGVLLLDRSKSENEKPLQPISGSSGVATVVSLCGAEIKPRTDRKKPKQKGHGAKNSSKSDELVIEIDTPNGNKEFIKFESAQEYKQWMRELKASARSSSNSGAKSDNKTSAQARPQQRVVDVSYPDTWEAPFDRDRLVPLHHKSKEYKFVKKLVLEQQYKPSKDNKRSKPYVQGKIKVLGVSRVQAPRLWEAYSMRRALIAADNDGDPNENLLWHGTQATDIILKHGLDPRVCSLRGMFGGGVYFADLSTKSVRYSGAQFRQDSGKLMLCRVSLGRQMVKYLPEQDLRRPPDPFALFPSQFMDWLLDKKYHSLFAPCGNLSMLLMSEYIVFHTNQGVPEYVIDFELV